MDIPPKSPRPPRAPLAFSLVEVVIALGIFTFAIVAIIGLLSTSLSSERDSARDTALAQMAQSTQSLLESRGFSYVSTNTTFASNSAVPYLYFDNSGRMAVTAGGAPDPAQHADSTFSCTVVRRASPISTNVSTNNLLTLQLQFRWPIAAPPAKQELRVVNASIAKYN